MREGPGWCSRPLAGGVTSTVTVVGNHDRRRRRLADSDSTVSLHPSLGWRQCLGGSQSLKPAAVSTPSPILTAELETVLCACVDGTAAGGGRGPVGPSESNSETRTAAAAAELERCGGIVAGDTGHRPIVFTFVMGLRVDQLATGAPAAEHPRQSIQQEKR